LGKKNFLGEISEPIVEFRVEQIQNIDFYDNQHCFHFFDKDYRKLFHMLATMIDAEEFIEKFLERRQGNLVCNG
jgi:hypothetical protein